MSLPAQLMFALLPFAALQKPAPTPAPSPAATAQAASGKAVYSTGRFQVELGGHTQAIAAFEGTTMRVDNSVPRERSADSKRAGNLRCEDVKLTLPLLPGDGFVQWMNDSLAGKPSLQALRIVEAGRDGKPLFAHSLSEASIRAIELPMLDATSKQPMPGFEVSIGAGQLKWEAPGGKLATTGMKQKALVAGAFRVQVNGIAVEHVTAVGPIRVESLARGAGAKSQNAMSVTPIRLRINDDDPKFWLTWLDETVTKPQAARTLSVEVLDNAGALVLVRIVIAGATPTSLSRMSGNAEHAQGSGLEVELAAGSVSLEFPGKSAP